MLKKKWIYTISIFFTISIILIACTNNKKTPKEGFWRMQMNLGEAMLPFNFELKKTADNYKMIIHNAKESIEVNEITKQNDSLFIQLPVYETEFHLKINRPDKITGVWINYYKGDDYKIKVEANHDERHRFFKKVDEVNNIENRYKVRFNVKQSSSFPAIGLFKQKEDSVSGTFVTETGDYRHLEGQIKKDSLFLSSFDGAVAYLFKAQLKDNEMHGGFWSGIHYFSNWKATKDNQFQLSNPDSLTFLKAAYDSLTFSFPDLNGNIVSSSDDRFKNKVVIIQIMGSWCHNCLDETKFLNQLYEKYKNDGLQVIALAFERTKSKDQAIKNIHNIKNNSQATYPFLLASWNKKTKAEQKLPMLNHIISYPTSIFVNRKGEIVKIHTGFYGPGSGQLYDDYVHKTDALIEKLLAE